jgi:hypothetical protein
MLAINYSTMEIGGFKAHDLGKGLRLNKMINCSIHVELILAFTISTQYCEKGSYG